MPEEKICPLLSGPEKLVPCQKNSCMWFHQELGMMAGKGSCVLGAISFEIRQVNSRLETIARSKK